MDRHFGERSEHKPSKTMLDSIVESANGDIRIALMGLQFSSGYLTREWSGKKQKTSREL
jgi:hypothetical protein